MLKLKSKSVPQAVNIQNAKNSATHGIFISPVVLRNENNQEFLTLERDYTGYYAPVGPAERKLIEEMAVCEWRQRRVWTTETAGIDLQMDQDAAEIRRKFNRIDEPVRAAIALKNLADNSSFLELMHRYETRFSRQYDRALRRLLDLQDRRNREPQPPQGEKAILQNETAPAETEPRPSALDEHDASTTRELRRLHPAAGFTRPCTPAEASQPEPQPSASRQPADAHYPSRLFVLVSPPEVTLK